MTPSNTAAALSALRVLKREPERIKALADISQYMRDGLKEKGLKIKDSTTPIIPIYTYTLEKTLAACNILFERGVYVNPVIPPAAPAGECLIRTSYTATHTKEQIDTAISRIAVILNELGVIKE